MEQKVLKTVVYKKSPLQCCFIIIKNIEKGAMILLLRSIREIGQYPIVVVEEYRKYILTLPVL